MLFLKCQDTAQYAISVNVGCNVAQLGGLMTTTIARFHKILYLLWGYLMENVHAHYLILMTT